MITKVDGQPVGWIAMTYIAKASAHNGPGHVFVDELWVDPKHRNKGIAKKLMEKAEDTARACQANGVRFYGNTENTVAWHLYEACGYRECGTAVFMEKLFKE